MKYINVIESFYPSLSRQEKKVADYILEKKSLITYQSLQEIAKEVGVGDATVIRFVKKIGFSGFQDLKLAIAKEDTEVVEIEYDDYIDNIHANINNTISNTKSLINKDELEKSIDLICNSNRVFLYGVGASGIAAIEMENRLMRFGKITHSYIDSHFQSMSAAIIKPNDLVIGISLSGQTTDLLESLEIAKKNGAKIISITNHIASPVAKISDYVLLTAGRETLLDGGSLVAKISQLYVIDILCTGYAIRNKEEAIKMKQKAAEAVIIKNKN